MRKSKINEDKAPAYSIILEPENQETTASRMQRLGTGALMSHELIAVIISMNDDDDNANIAAQSLLRKNNGLRGLTKLTLDDLVKHGIDKHYAMKLVSALELARRIGNAGLGERTIITSPKDVAAYLMHDLRDEKREHFIALLLDTKNHVVKQTEISIGSLDMSLVNPRELFREAIREGAASIIVAHNHPSGDPEPSTADINITKQLCKAGELVGIQLLDHLIIGDGLYTSLKERGDI